MPVPQQAVTFRRPSSLVLFALVVQARVQSYLLAAAWDHGFQDVVMIPKTAECFIVPKLFIRGDSHSIPEFGCILEHDRQSWPVTPAKPQAPSV